MCDLRKGLDLSKLGFLFELRKEVDVKEMTETEHYIAFVLGRRALLDMDIKNSDEFIGYEDDLAFDDCCKLAIIFTNSKFNNFNQSLYDCIDDFINYLKGVCNDL